MAKPVFVAKVCPNCGKDTLVAISETRFDRWKSGEHIQDVFPDLTSMERETLMSGVCSDKCWDEMWPDDE